MKQLLLLLMLILLCSCGEKNKTEKVVATTVQKSKYRTLLSKFENISIDTLEIYSSENFGIYKGVQIDSLDAILFPKEIAEAYFLEHDIYACCKFDIDSSKIGLIVRTPSMYVPSSIKLFVFDKITDNISEYIELAESWGDAGDAIEKTSWLIKNPSNKINVLTREIESHDHSVEDENDTIVESWDKYYLFAFNHKLDTINKNSDLLKKKFNVILNKQASH
ncbi:hypothetical protein [Flavobacterium sp. ACAM 123]|uniref:hypothetical protein n=1 Tax=Flavobacterium sp. ACAM 123 TaxID=1189620 RepID=UPI00036A101D|nr:hypothetical protein [Flavobacterium sp. ACAM 123]